MTPKIPKYTDRNPEQIIGSQRHSDSAWRTHQALSWLDYAKRQNNVTALEYAALELRYAIEELWFEVVVVSVAGKLDERRYLECTSHATKLYKILRRLVPDYSKLIRFANICLEHDAQAPRLIEWDIERLMEIHGRVSAYLHFKGNPTDTWSNPEWIAKFTAVIDTGAQYLWKNCISGRTGIMRPENMEEEVHIAWGKFRDGKLSAESVRFQMKIAQPALHARRSFRQST